MGNALRMCGRSRSQVERAAWVPAGGGGPGSKNEQKGVASMLWLGVRRQVGSARMGLLRDGFAKHQRTKKPTFKGDVDAVARELVRVIGPDLKALELAIKAEDPLQELAAQMKRAREAMQGDKLLPNEAYKGRHAKQLVALETLDALSEATLDSDHDHGAVAQQDVANRDGCRMHRSNQSARVQLEKDRVIWIRRDGKLLWRKRIHGIVWREVRKESWVVKSRAEARALANRR